MSPHCWHDRELVIGKFEKNEFVARVMDHLIHQFSSDPPTRSFLGVGDKVDESRPVA